MSFIEDYNKFRELEEKLDLFDLCIQGFLAWDYLRFPMWRQFLEKRGTTAKAHYNEFTRQRPRRLARAKSWLNVVKHSVRYELYSAKGCDYVFLGHPRRKLRDDGAYWDLYCDPVIDHLGPRKCVLLEAPYPLSDKVVHAQPPHTKQLIYNDELSLERRSVERKLKRNHKPAIQVKASEQTILRRFETAFLECTGSPAEIHSRIQRSHHFAEFTRIFFERLLGRLKPKAVFLVCSYGLETQISVCRKYGIPTIELQHGTMTPYHIGYSYPDTAKKTLFPDYFFSFGEFWQNSVSLPLSNDRVFCVGYPYFEEEIQARRDTDKQNMVLFISQGVCGESLSRFAVSLLEHLPAEWRVVFKLHPGEVNGWRERYVELANSPISVIENDCPNLYQLMAQARIQIGVSSTALFEGLGFGCQTYIVSLPGHENMGRLIASGQVELVDSPAQISFEGTDSGSAFPKGEFFADNWKDNFDKAMSCVRLAD